MSGKENTRGKGGFKAKKFAKFSKLPDLPPHDSPSHSNLPTPPIDGSKKLSKQERRNLNKQKKALPQNAVAAPARKETPTVSVYKRPTEYPEPISNYIGPWDRFITPNDSELNGVLDACYKGCVISPPEEFESKFHADFRAAFEGLDAEGLFQYDVTQPAGLGTKTAKTYVTRCLVGEAGTTYKYLGLRMFSVPWNVPADGAAAALSTPSAVQIGKLNEVMVTHTEQLLRQRTAQESRTTQPGSCRYNLTLINRYVTLRYSTSRHYRSGRVIFK